MDFRKKPVVIQAITFDQLVRHGRDVGANIVGGMPWSFDYKGHPISHENDRCYLIPTLEGTMNMTPDDMLITGVKGEIYPCKKDIFAATYDAVVADDAVERAIVAAGKTAPRVTPAHITSIIASEHYFTAAQGAIHDSALSSIDLMTSAVPALGLLTFCVLVLKNGFTVTGESACASPENFDEDIGRQIAFANAKEKIWPLEGYLLKQRLAAGAEA